MQLNFYIFAFYCECRVHMLIHVAGKLSCDRDICPGDPNEGEQYPLTKICGFYLGIWQGRYRQYQHSGNTGCMAFGEHCRRTLMNRLVLK